MVKVLSLPMVEKKKKDGSNATLQRGCDNVCSVILLICLWVAILGMGELSTSLKELFCIFMSAEMQSRTCNHNRHFAKDHNNLTLMCALALTSAMVNSTLKCALPPSQFFCQCIIISLHA